MSVPPCAAPDHDVTDQDIESREREGRAEAGQGQGQGREGKSGALQTVQPVNGAGIICHYGLLLFF